MSDNNFRDFIKLNRELLRCYGSLVPNDYKKLNPEMQRDFCFAERLRVED